MLNSLESSQFVPSKTHVARHGKDNFDANLRLSSLEATRAARYQEILTHASRRSKKSTKKLRQSRPILAASRKSSKWKGPTFADLSESRQRAPLGQSLHSCAAMRCP